MPPRRHDHVTHHADHDHRAPHPTNDDAAGDDYDDTPDHNHHHHDQPAWRHRW